MQNSKKKRSWQAAWTGKAGFTLVELITTVMIVGILSAISGLIILQSMPRYKLREEARNLLGHFQQAKLEAVKRGTVVAIVFNTAANSYEIFTDTPLPGNNMPGDFIRDPVAGENLLISVNLDSRINLFNSLFAAGGPGLNTGFSSRGLPLKDPFAGNSPLSGEAYLMVAGDTSMYLRINLSPAGSVRLQTCSGPLPADCPN